MSDDQLQKDLIRMVQIHMGHVSLSTTQQYSHVTTESVANKVRTILPGYRGKKKTWGYITKNTKSNVPDPETNGANRIFKENTVSLLYSEHKIGGDFNEFSKFSF